MGCAACAQVCPSGAIEFKDRVISGKARRTLIIHWDICIFCGNCQANCPTAKGIILSREFDFATTENRETLSQEIEKEITLCEGCEEMVLPQDQIHWVEKRLGPLCFSNTSLILIYLRSLVLGLKGEFLPKEEREFLRSDRMKILCPRCRREAVFKS
jgi:hydrogenase-4 component H